MDSLNRARLLSTVRKERRTLDNQVVKLTGALLSKRLINSQSYKCVTWKKPVAKQKVS